MTNVQRWYVGDTPRLQCYFYVATVLTDPSTITLKVEDPAGVISTYTYAGATVSKTGTGDYYKDVNVPLEGTWKYRWASSGTVTAAREDEFEVERSDFA